MASQLLADLQAQVTATVGVEQSALVFIQGEAARIQAAVDAAVAGGATPAELAPVQAEIDAMKASAADLAAAIPASPPAARR